MKLTRRRAIDISIEVWEYLRDHPEIQFKCYLPEKIYKKIKKSRYECLLCDLYICKGIAKANTHPDRCNKKCPLWCCFYFSNNDYHGIFNNWALAVSDKSRARWAGAICNKLYKARDKEGSDGK